MESFNRPEFSYIRFDYHAVVAEKRKLNIEIAYGGRDNEQYRIQKSNCGRLLLHSGTKRYCFGEVSMRTDILEYLQNEIYLRCKKPTNKFGMGVIIILRLLLRMVNY